ncbi:MAG: hypothetical protein LBT89_12135 [Planctomycetaceae bacterium]|jgi:hypothetical protein|nr:hypothetical protein [Planctomycetaceae bacterium]
MLYWNHYETAFEAFLRQKRIPYIAVEEPASFAEAANLFDVRKTLPSTRQALREVFAVNKISTDDGTVPFVHNLRKARM